MSKRRIITARSKKRKLEEEERRKARTINGSVVYDVNSFKKVLTDALPPPSVGVMIFSDKDSAEGLTWLRIRLGDTVTHVYDTNKVEFNVVGFYLSLDDVVYACKAPKRKTLWFKGSQLARVISEEDKVAIVNRAFLNNYED